MAEEAPVPVIASAPGAGWTRGEALRGWQRPTAVLIGVGAGVLVFLGFVFLAVVLYFCLDLDIGGDDGINDCAAKDQASQVLVFWIGAPVSVATMATAWWLTVRLFRRANARKR